MRKQAAMPRVWSVMRKDIHGTDRKESVQMSLRSRKTGVCKLKPEGRKERKGDKFS